MASPTPEIPDKLLRNLPYFHIYKVETHSTTECVNGGQPHIYHVYAVFMEHSQQLSQQTENVNDFQQHIYHEYAVFMEYTAQLSQQTECVNGFRPHIYQMHAVLRDQK